LSHKQWISPIPLPFSQARLLPVINLIKACFLSSFLCFYTK
jgi:hypothetical protein